jgi:hypothetical protein
VPFVLNNIPTPDDYDSSSELQCPGVIQLDIFVGNAAIYYSYAIRNPAQGSAVLFRKEVFLPPGFHCRARCAEAVKVRSALAGTPAQVTIEAVLPEEMNCG